MLLLKKIRIQPPVTPFDLYLFLRFYGLMRRELLLTDQMEGPVPGSVMGTELHLDQMPARWGWGTGMGWYY